MSITPTTDSSQSPSTAQSDLETALQHLASLKDDVEAKRKSAVGLSNFAQLLVTRTYN